MKQTTLLTLAFALFLSSITTAQVAINQDDTPPDASALLDLKSTDKGMLMPRMTTAERENIASPATGLIVYDTDKKAFYMFDGNDWYEILLSRDLIDTYDTQNSTLSSDGAADDFFGFSTSIHNDYAVVGAYKDDDNGSKSGSVYVYKKKNGSVNAWEEIKKITASDGLDFDYFGYSVSINNNYIVIGAYGDDDNGSNSGSAYIYKKDEGGIDNWGELKKITAADGASDDYFGYNISINNNYIVVGAHGDDDNGSNSGSAYIYKKDEGGIDNWGELKKITAADAAAGDFFGFSTSINNNYIVMGAHGDDDNGSSSGSAYIYKKDEGGIDNWGELKKITAADAAAGDLFGYGLSLSNDYIVIGAYGDDDNGNLSGSAYIYKKDEGGIDNWGELKKLTASDGAAADYFGISVSINNNYIIIGAYRDNDNGNLSGSAYIYKKDEGGIDNWGELKKITASDGAAADYFGISVGVSSGTAVIGASRKNNDQGSVYFEIIETEDVDFGAIGQNIQLSGNKLSLSNADEIDLSNLQINKLKDTDGDTYIDVEQGSNDNIIRFYIESSQVLAFEKNANGELMIQNPVSNNVFIGTNAGYNNISGRFNTFIGYNSGNDNTFGHENTFLGYNAGSNNLIGNSNTFLGYNAGRNSTGNNNVFIGRTAGYTETGNHKLYIHNTSSSSPLIYGEFDNDILTVNGDLGINTTTPAAELHIEDGVDASLSAHGYMVLGGTNATNIVIDNNEIIARFNGANSTLYIQKEGGTTEFGGDVCHSGSLTSCSDKRYKKDFQPIEQSLTKLTKINGLYYNWDRAAFPNKNFTTKRQIGVIAQDVEVLFPELVRTDEAGYKSVDYSRFTPIMIEAIKEQQVKITSLEIRNKELAAQIEQQATQYEKLEAQITELQALKAAVAKLELKIEADNQTMNSEE